MSKDDTLYFGHMLDMARKACAKTRSIGREDYDADENLRLALAHLIQVIGEARNGEEAIAQTQQLRPDVITMDLTMPKMDGVQTLREIRKFDQEVPVILSSGFAERDATRRFGDAGFQGFIQKPYVPQDLAREIRKIMKNGQT